MNGEVEKDQLIMSDIKSLLRTLYKIVDKLEQRIATLERKTK